MQDQIANLLQTLVYAVLGGGSTLYAMNRLLSRLGWGRFRPPTGDPRDNPDGV